MDILNIKSWFNQSLPEPEFKQPLQQYTNQFFDLKEFSISSELQQDKKLVFDGYITNADVYAINKRICDAISEIEIELYSYTKKDKIEIESGDYYELFRNPNTSQSWNDFIHYATLNLNLTGDLFIKKYRIGNKIVSLEPLRTLGVNIVEDGKGGIHSYTYTKNGFLETIQKEDIIHIKYENPYKDTFWGLSPLQAGYLSLVTSNECNNANANLLANRGISAIISSPSNEGANSMLPTDAEKIQSALRKKIGGSSKANGVTVTSAQIEVNSLGMSSADLEIIRSQEITLRQLCRVYGANSQIFGDTESSTYSNMNEATKAFYTQCVLPILNKIVRGIENDFKNEKLDTKLKKDFFNIEIEVCTDDIESLQEDQKLKIEKQKMLSDGVLIVVKDYNQNLITYEQAEQILKNIYDLDEEEVKIYLTKKPIIKQNTTNE